MDLAQWRDLIIVVWGLIATLGVIFLCIIIFLFYRKIASLIDAADAVAGKAGEILNYADEEIIRPTIQFGAMIKGVIQGIDLFKKMFRKNEEEEDEDE